ncbi:hypothetical protein I3760_01G013600 [Carya illinoinensis]|nr:hypothetical protein I3760_01G013600 [Carya illinoinensis]
MVVSEDVADLDYPQLMAMGEKFERAAAKMTKDTAHSAITGGDGASSRQIIMGNPTYQPASRMDSGIPGPINLDGCKLPPGYIPPTKQLWNLPTAGIKGVMLVLPDDIEQYDEAISRWESITINYINGMNWDSNLDKVYAIENTLGEKEKLTWLGWRAAYENEYNGLMEMAGEARNITSAIRRMFTGKDAYQGDVGAQNRAYVDLERLTCKDMSHVFSYLNQYFSLAAKSGRMWVGSELSEKFLGNYHR